MQCLLSLNSQKSSDCVNRGNAYDWLFENAEIEFSDQIITKMPNEFDKARPDTVFLLSDTPA